ncbi:methyltransferase domain-containing protein [Lysobacter enzymogenes]|uniref:methyltransferase domain-containing protein n=1 Tax=Lysobacter enzymogenes TaxID=69 RepID=UPI00374A8908
MPALSHGRQPDPGPGPGPAPGQGAALRWFGEISGHGLLEVEAGAMARVLGASPPLPWAWFGVAAAQPPHGRGVALRRSVEGFDGAVRCRLPLPLASEAFGAVLLQHVFDDGADPLPLLGECARILAPGGRLWLATLNPWSPYRLRWARSGLHARDAGHWQAALRSSGFAADPVSLQWLGPRWRAAHGEAGGIGAADVLRAGLALSLTKRVHAAIPPTRLQQLRWQTGLVPRDAAAQRGAAARKREDGAG